MSIGNYTVVLVAERQGEVFQRSLASFNAVSNYIVVLVAVRSSTTCTGGISNIVQIFANKNVTLLKIMTRQIKLKNDWTVKFSMNI